MHQCNKWTTPPPPTLATGNSVLKWNWIWLKWSKYILTLTISEYLNCYSFPGKSKMKGGKERTGSKYKGKRETFTEQNWARQMCYFVVDVLHRVNPFPSFLPSSPSLTWHAVCICFASSAEYFCVACLAQIIYCFLWLTLWSPFILRMNIVFHFAFFISSVF